VTRQSDDNDRRRHENACRSDRARRQPGDATDAMTRGTSAAEPAAKADKQAGDYDHDPARRYFGEGNWKAGQAGAERRDNQAAKKAMRQLLSRAPRSCQLALADNLAIPLAGTVNLFIGTLMRLGSLI
jgi:hypothetical protein